MLHYTVNDANVSNACLQAENKNHQQPLIPNDFVVTEPRFTNANNQLDTIMFFRNHISVHRN
jgi:hypothetical protein